MYSSWLFICEQNHIAKDVPLIFDAVFECTLDMINKVTVSRHYTLCICTIIVLLVMCHLLQCLR